MKEARAVHGDYYEYDATRYTKMSAKVTIRCPKHGWITMGAQNHIRKGQGCQICTKPRKEAKARKAHQAQSMTFTEFEQRATAIFGKRYIYHPETFTKGNAETVVTCRIHGNFVKNACGHLAGRGCPTCVVVTTTRKSARTRAIPFPVFVERAQAIFDDRYSYEESSYSGVSKPVTILCEEHGPFVMRGSEHLKGNKCKKCSFNRSRPERMLRKLLTEAGIAFEEQWNPKALREAAGRNLSYDFYLPEAKVIIEYDGRHHFQPCFGSTPEKAQEVFERTVRNDHLKDAWAAQEGYRLYRLQDEQKLARELKLILEELYLPQ